MNKIVPKNDLMIKKVPTINIDWMRNIVPKNDRKKKIVPKNIDFFKIMVPEK